MKPLILLDAAPFCYGPISTLLAVIDELGDDAVDFVLLASGTSAEFAAARRDRIEIVACNTESEADLARHEALFRRCALFVCNTNPTSAAYAKELGCRVAYIDTLFWMWDRVDPRVARADLFLVQEFAGVAENRARIGAEIAAFQLVGPLIASAPRRTDPGGACIVSFGGIESSLTVPGQTNRYPWWMARLLLAALARRPRYERYRLCGRDHVMRSVAAELGAPADVAFGFVPHDEFVAEIGRAGLYLLSPGLTGVYEAVAARPPTVLLLPQNYSQQLQAQTFIDDPRWGLRGLDWRHVYDEFVMPRFLGEAEAVAQLNEVILRFERDAAAQARYVDRLAEVIAAVERGGGGGGSAPASGTRAAAAAIRGLIPALADVKEVRR